MDESNVYEYAQKMNVNDEFSDRCNSKAEIDAVIACLYEIEQVRSSYHQALALAPRNPARALNEFQSIVKKFNFDEEAAQILYEEEKDFYFSQIKPVKNSLVRQMHLILTQAGIGKKRREKLIPRLIESLQDVELIEDIGEPVPDDEIKDFLSKIKRK